MASVQKRKDKYVVIYDYKDNKDIRKQKWKSFDTKPEAVKFKNEIESSKIHNNFINPTNVTVSEFFDEWLRIHAQSNWQYKTYLMSKSLIDTHIIPSLGDINIQKLTPKEVEKFINQLRFKKISTPSNREEHEIPYLSPTTIAHIHTLLKSAFEKAIEWKILSENPVTCKKPTRAKVDTTIWDVNEVQTALHDITHEQLHLAVHLSFICSLRVGEALALTWDCINIDKSIISINKTLQRTTKDSINLLPNDNLNYMFPSRTADSKSVLILKSPKTSSSDRTVYITNELKRELMNRKRQIESDKQYYGKKYTDYNLVFALEDGYPVEPKLCEKWFNKWKEKSSCELPDITFHEIRHSSTTYKLSLTGGDIKSVQGDTGHANADMVVNRYSHIQDKARRNMADLLEKDFYNKADEDTDIETLLQIINKNPEIQKQLLEIFTENATK